MYYLIVSDMSSGLMADRRNDSTTAGKQIVKRANWAESKFCDVLRVAVSKKEQESKLTPRAEFSVASSPRGDRQGTGNTL